MGFLTSEVKIHVVFAFVMSITSSRAFQSRPQGHRWIDVTAHKIAGAGTFSHLAASTSSDSFYDINNDDESESGASGRGHANMVPLASSLDMTDISSSRVSRRAAMGVSVAATAAGAATLGAKPAFANSKSRSEGYQVQKSPAEWRSSLSGLQYEILRDGGTERPFSSILEMEKRAGVFECAGCGTPLFESDQKFNSGTGWPSFADGTDGVEIEAVNPVRYQLGGAELRCATCGGHLGDVFADGYLFANTPAAKTGKRYCIDGAALVFYPSDGGEPLRGDVPRPKTASSQPSWLDPPKIEGRIRESS